MRYSSIEGRPHYSGVSRNAHQQKPATHNATIAGKMNAARQLSAKPTAVKTAIPADANKDIVPEPVLCEVFQIDILKLRSFCENQCAIIRPQGGQPIPESQPTANIKAKRIPPFTAIEDE